MIHLVFFLFGAIMIYFLSKNVMELLFSLQDYSIHQKRLNQLKRETYKVEETNYEKVEKIADPIIKYFFPLLEKYLPALKIANLELLKRELKMIGWEDTFSSETFIALAVGLKVIGIFVFLISMGISGSTKLIFFIIAGVAFFGMEKWFKMELKGKKDRLFNDFPDFIRITSGYLSADMPLVQSIQDAVKYVSSEWKPILQQFIVDCDNKSQSIALDNLKENVDLFEVKEFVALVRLTIEQGGNVKDGFIKQAEKIVEMQKNLLVKKVSGRKTMSQVVQGPLLLINMAVLALPTLGNVFNTL